MNFLVDLKMNYKETFTYLENKKKQRLINNLEMGDLIKVKSDYHPLIFHYGIVEKSSEGDFIIHNHPDKKNKQGGNTIKEPLNEWLKGKEIISVEKTKINLNELKEIYEAVKPYKYDFFHYNCEHFVNFVKDNKYISNHVIKYTSYGLLVFLVYYLFKNKKF